MLGGMLQHKCEDHQKGQALKGLHRVQSTKRQAAQTSSQRQTQSRRHLANRQAQSTCSDHMDKVCSEVDDHNALSGEPGTRRRDPTLGKRRRTAMVLERQERPRQRQRHGASGTNFFPTNTRSNSLSTDSTTKRHQA